MPTIVKVVVTNRLTRLFPPYPKDEIRDYFRYHPKGYIFSPKYRFGGWDGYLNLMQRSLVGTGLFLHLYQKIEQDLDLTFDIEDTRVFPDFSSFTRHSARAFQNVTVDAMIAASNMGGLILNATASGKTSVAAMYFSRLEGNACFVVDELGLLSQARKEISVVLQEEVGEIGHGIWNPKRITTATVQSLHIQREKPRFASWAATLEAVIIDEFHTQLNRRNFDTVAAIFPKAVFGLTATLNLRQKDIQLRAYSIAGPVIHQYPLARGVKEGYLTPGLCISVETVTALPIDPKDYLEEYDVCITQNLDRNDIIVGIAKACLDLGKHVIILVERLEHIRKLHFALTQVPHKMIFGGRKVAKREEIQEQFGTGEVRLIIANKVFKKGISINRVDAIIDGAALSSKNDTIQKFGRGVRLCNGKDGLLYFDVSDLPAPYQKQKNRFAKAARSRFNALKKIKVPQVQVSSWKMSCDELVKRSQNYLETKVLQISRERPL